MLPERSIPPEKMYFSISEVAGMFQVNASLIRYWEKEFDILKPKKNRKGNRMFSRQDIEHLRLIFHLTKEKGYTIDGARKVIHDRHDEVGKIAEVTMRLRKIREELLQIKGSLGG